MGKSRTKFYSAAIAKKSGKLVPIGKALRFEDGSIYLHLEKKRLSAKCIKLEPIEDRS